MKVGVTGGIGSGKSIVLQVFEAHGYPVFRSDEEAKKVINKDEVVKSQIVELLGPNSYSGENYNSDWVAQKVFENKEVLSQLNSIIHPVVRRNFEAFAKKNSQSPFCFNEAAILYETGAHQNFDQMILVTAPIELRINRVMIRDNSDRNRIEGRIKSQWSDERKRSFNPFEILNNDKSSVLLQVEEFIEKFS